MRTAGDGAWVPLGSNAVALRVDTRSCGGAAHGGVSPQYFATLVAAQDPRDISDGTGGTDAAWWRDVGSTATMEATEHSFLLAVANPFIGATQLAQLAAAHHWRVSWVAARGARTGMAPAGGWLLRWRAACGNGVVGC